MMVPIEELESVHEYYGGVMKRDMDALMNLSTQVNRARRYAHQLELSLALLLVLCFVLFAWGKR